MVTQRHGNPRAYDSQLQLIVIKWKCTVWAGNLDFFKERKYLKMLATHSVIKMCCANQNTFVGHIWHAGYWFATITLRCLPQLSGSLSFLMSW